MSKPNYTVDKSVERSMGTQHGCLIDRGAADAYYHRDADPHWYPEGTYNNEKVNDLNEMQIARYMKGFNEQDDFKQF